MDVTAIYLPFKKEFEPVVRIGENIAIPKGEETYEFYKVTYIEPVQPIIIGVPLVALQKDYAKMLNEIKLHDHEAGQWRLFVLDFAEVKMNFPRAAARWTTKEATTSVKPISIEKEQFLEFYSHKDEVPTVYVTNPRDEPQYVRLAVYGFKYSLKPLGYSPGEYTVFPAYSSTYIIGGGGI